MEWSDDGIVISVRRHGESSAIVTLLTKDHGRAAGLVHGARGPKLRGVLQPGNAVHATWRARLADHLGTYALEAQTAHAAEILTDGNRLCALTSACALIEFSLPERQPDPDVYALMEGLMQALAGEDWASDYVRWEMGLLTALGFGLDLTACAATGVLDDLVYVSPKTGRAVSREAGLPYHDRMLTLPAFLKGNGNRPSTEAIIFGLDLTGFFLNRYVLAPHERTLPDSRERLRNALTRSVSLPG